ncbi:MAG: AAA family ATPase [Zoogloeaceae bacterium]|jgi:type II secretory pathway predicted ATPase ExeA|nr:AAA family ATPase [Zoogloeaceae bacterium]
MYLDHFGLIAVPFRITPRTEFFFAGANRGATLDALIYAIRHDEGIIKVSGEVGSGKTLLCRVLMEHLTPHVVPVYLANPSLSREDTLFAIADDLGLKIISSARAGAVLRSLQRKLVQLHKQGRRVVVLIDEAHAMPIDTLEEIRLLSNLEANQQKLLQLALFGQPELDEILARPDMRQLKERITQSFTLEPLSPDDIAKYIDFRLRTAGYRGPPLFSLKAIELIADASLGLARRVNILAEKSLLAAFAAGVPRVSSKEAAAAIRESEYHGPRPLLYRLAAATVISAAVVFLAFLGFLATAYLPDRHAAPTPPATVVFEEPKPIAIAVAPVPMAAAVTPEPAAIAAPEPVTAAVAPEPVTAAVAPEPPTAPAVDPAITPALAAAIAQLNPQTRERLRETQQWIATTENDHWFIQLAITGAQQTEYAQNYLEMADRLLQPEHAKLYAADTGKDRRIGIIYGDFPTMAAASTAIGRLPPELRSGNPFPRQVVRLK